MRKSGWFRLWVVLSLPIVGAATYLDALPSRESWWAYQEQDMSACTWLEANLPTHPSGHDCQAQYLTSHAMYDYLHTTFIRFWLEAIGVGVVVDLLVTLLVLLLVLAVVWVRRGFRHPAAV